MYCPKCKIMFPYNIDPPIENCTVCGLPFEITCLDIFKDGAFDIAQESRPSQLALAEEIEDFLSAGLTSQAFFAEGGTGIGKSFAYLVPPLLANRRVVIATTTKGLQSQLYDKDLAFLLQQLGLFDKKAMLYKGRGNYACWQLTPRKATSEEREQYSELIGNARGSNAPADRDDWEGPVPSWWTSISAENCIGIKCPHYTQGCRLDPQSADILIVNHHLLGIDLMLGAGNLFGEYDTLIVDEAHKASDAFRSAYEHTISKSFAAKLNAILFSNPNLKSDVFEASLGRTMLRFIIPAIEKLEGEVRDLYNSIQGSYDKVTRIASDITRHQTHTQDIARSAQFLQEKLVFVSKELNTRCVVNEHYAVSADNAMVHMGAIAAASRKCDSLLRFCAKFKKEYINNWILTIDTERDALSILPVKMGPIVGPQLNCITNKVFTSATLQINSDFTHIRNEVGLGEKSKCDVITATYESPFNLDEQALLYLPRHIPPPANFGSPPKKRTEWIAAITKEIVRLTNLTKGNAFVLFSARSDMDEVAAYRERYFPQPGLTTLIHQEDATPLLQKYRETDNCILYGLKTFWEGVDVKGPKLQLVIIPKLPFPHANDPIIKTLTKLTPGDIAGFYHVSFPRMVFTLKQGVGRLIRTQKDYGIAAILDPRIWTGSATGNDAKVILANATKSQNYGAKITKALGLNRIRDNFTQVQKFAKRRLQT
ncbi:MAG: hypothetical protein DRP01_00225 [Archaeoglobales archaeon]|nr:MAG: hypothetical protein DRP01_00225 [Archaeoglobales archaeon]